MAPPGFKGLLSYERDTGGDLAADSAEGYCDPNLTLEDPAYIQFTSGSTAAPKGVLISQANLAHNAHGIMREALQTDPQRDRCMSWLPLFHDMGLAFVIAPLIHQVPVTFMQPKAFPKRPARWLRVISKERATITFAPNFAYAMATKRIKEEELAQVDLSDLRVAGCGGEPIEPKTLKAFAKRFSPYGFR
jgi:acyl-CoA synthetase (AMP-forming)/AMP-acid ligase II